MSILIVISCVLLKPTASVDELSYLNEYQASWDSLDNRPLPQWYDAAKIGIFIHWGVYSVPAFKNEWFWKFWDDGEPTVIQFLQNNYPQISYQDFAPMFTAQLFQPEKWAQLFAESGAKYVVITSKHHDGYCLFPSMQSNWTSSRVGPKIDIIGVLSSTLRNAGLKFGVYYSISEWFNEMYKSDRESGFKNTQYRDKVLIPDLKQLVIDYRPSVLWVDGEWDTDDRYFQSTSFLSWLYSVSPVRDDVVVNDRWGNNVNCKHGDFYNCKDHYNPRTLQDHKWENAMTLDKKSWGFRRDMRSEDILPFTELLEQIVSTVSCGGNILINVGPTKEGVIPLAFEYRLKELGNWLKINGEAIYNTSPWQYQRDSLNENIWYTCLRYRYDGMNPTSVRSNEDVTAIYAIFIKWPADDILVMSDILKTDDNIKMLILNDANGGGRKLSYTRSSGNIEVDLPERSRMASDAGWVIKITHSLSFKFPGDRKYPIQKLRSSAFTVVTSVTIHTLRNKMKTI